MQKESIRKDRGIESIVENYLQSRLPGIFQILARKINISQLIAASGTFKDLDIDKVEMGEAKIDKLLLQGTSATIHSGGAFLQNVRINLELKLTLDWWVDIWVYDDSGTENLGSLWFNLPIGNVRIPSLEDISLTIPTVCVENIQADMTPISNLDLGGGSFNKLNATETTVPTNGFQLSGLGLGNFNLTNIQVPETSTSKVKIDQFKPDSELVLPGAKVSHLQVPWTAVNNIQSDAFSFNGELVKRGVSVNLGIFGVTFWVKPVAHIAIDKMLLQDVSLSADVSQARIENVRVPIDISGISMKNVTMTDISVNDISG